MGRAVLKEDPEAEPSLLFVHKSKLEGTAKFELGVCAATIHVIQKTHFQEALCHTLGFKIGL